MRRFKWRTCLVVALAAAAGFYADVQAQDNCPDDGDPGSQTATLTLKKADGTCTAEDGGYVKVGTQYKLHIAASSTGGCQTNVPDCSPLPCICVPSTYYPRALGATQLFDSISPYYFGVVQPSPPSNTRAYDTTVPTGTTSTGAWWTPWAYQGLGPRTFTSVTYVTATPCGLSPTSFEEDEPLTVNVLECKPEWFTGGTPVVNFHGPPSGDIVIAIPSSAFEDARGPAEQAAADWAAALGRNITVQAGYATCTSTDPLCIEIKNDHGTKEGDPPGCASLGTASYNSTTGAWEGSTSVRFEPDWTGGHSDNLRWTIAHELGHYFGLENRIDPPCSDINTIMSSGNCYGTQSPTEKALGPTPSDVSPVMNSTYGNQVRNTCGW